MRRGLRCGRARARRSGPGAELSCCVCGGAIGMAIAVAAVAAEVTVLVVVEEVVVAAVAVTS